MGKKKLIIIIASILVVVAIGFGVGVGLSNKSPDGPIWFKENTIDFAAPHIGEEMFVLVNSIEDLNSIYGDSYNETYDKSFFKRKSLIVLTVETPDSGDVYSINDVFVENDVLTVDVKIEHHSGALTAEWNWRIIIEVKKSDIKGVTEIQKIFTECGNSA